MRRLEARDALGVGGSAELVLRLDRPHARRRAGQAAGRRRRGRRRHGNAAGPVDARGGRDVAGGSARRGAVGPADLRSSQHRSGGESGPRLRRGPIGVVGASGTGIQELTTLVHRLGGGISHAIGTGGRDLHAEVGGLTTLQGVAALGADSGTRVLLIVSKPSSPAAADAVLRAAVETRKPVVACLLGYNGATPQGVHTAATLEEAATTAVKLVAGTVRPPERPRTPIAGVRR